MAPRPKVDRTPEAPRFRNYHITIQVDGQIEGGTPKDPDVIASWLTGKGISNADVFQETVAAMSAPVPEGEPDSTQRSIEEKNWCGFKSDPERGLYIEARIIKAAFKEAAEVCRAFLKIVGCKARAAEKIWVWGLEDPQRIYLGVKEPDGFADRFVHTTRWMKGRGEVPINSIKRSDFVRQPTLTFCVEVLDDGMFTPEVIAHMLEYMQRNGLGANRSQLAGTFKVLSFQEVPAAKRGFDPVLLEQAA